MNEEERRLEILKAETTIRELAGKMAKASEYANQAEMAKDASRECIQSLDQARESLELGIRDLRMVQESLENGLNNIGVSLAESRNEFYEVMDTRFDKVSQDIKEMQVQLSLKADHFETTISKKNQENAKSLDSKLQDLTSDINKTQVQLSRRVDYLENSIAQSNQQIVELFDARLGNISQNIDTLSSKFLFVIDQNDASNKRYLAMQQTLVELSLKFLDFENDITNNLEEIRNLRTQMTQSKECVSNLEQSLETKSSELNRRLQFIMAGGIFAILLILIIMRIIY
jgi:chromosome segregation ATPase